MKNRDTKASVKQVASLIGRNILENSDYCLACGDETDISNLNLVTGVCNKCKKSSIEKMKELIKKASL